MSPMVKELAEQAGGTVLAGSEIQKFAELIVRECDRYACSVWEHGPLLGRDLLIHFGIEEMSDD